MIREVNGLVGIMGMGYFVKGYRPMHITKHPAASRIHSPSGYFIRAGERIEPSLIALRAIS